MKLENLKLCFIKDNFAYFTSQELSQQWGDDWNDAPYEDNAGLPYEDILDELNNAQRWKIIKVAFDGPFCLPDELGSVEDINAGHVAWLRINRYAYTPSEAMPNICIHAGTTLNDFIDKVTSVEGANVFLPVK